MVSKLLLFQEMIWVFDSLLTHAPYKVMCYLLIFVKTVYIQIKPLLIIGINGLSFILVTRRSYHKLLGTLNIHFLRKISVWLKFDTFTYLHFRFNSALSKVLVNGRGILKLGSLILVMDLTEKGISNRMKV